MTWASWRLESPAKLLFVQEFVIKNTRETLKPHMTIFMRGIKLNGQKVFPNDDVFVNCFSTVEILPHGTPGQWVRASSQYKDCLSRFGISIIKIRRSHGLLIFYSERPRGAGFRSVNPAERWCENPATALARAGFSQHLECGIHRSESSPEGSFALIPH